MTKKMEYLLLVFILILIVIASISLGFISKSKKKDNSITVESFDVGNYQSFIENSSSEESLGSISNAEDAITKAETVWVKIYGNQVKDEKPYKVFYDKENQIWLITGSLRPNTLGGVAYILLENDTGKVLAVWHDK